MAFEDIYRSKQYLELAELKKQADELKKSHVQVSTQMHKVGEPFYREIEKLILQTIRETITVGHVDTKAGIELAKRLCVLDVHPWQIKKRFVGSDYAYHGNHKKIPKYYIWYCPVCGKILNTSKRVYHWSLFKGYERVVVDISEADFTRGASECGYRYEKLERYVDELPRYDRFNNYADICNQLQELTEYHAPELKKAASDLITFFDKVQTIENSKNKQRIEAEKNADELCHIFGHDTSGPDEACRCCGKLLSIEQLQKDYEEATLSGVVSFPYVKGYKIV